MLAYRNPRNEDSDSIFNSSLKLDAYSLMVIGLSAFILAGSNVVGIELPDVVVWILGIVDLIALPLLVYSTVKKVEKE